MQILPASRGIPNIRLTCEWHQKYQIVLRLESFFLPARSPSFSWQACCKVLAWQPPPTAGGYPNPKHTTGCPEPPTWVESNMLWHKVPHLGFRLRILGLGLDTAVCAASSALFLSSALKFEPSCRQAYLLACHAILQPYEWQIVEGLAILPCATAFIRSRMPDMRQSQAFKQSSFASTLKPGPQITAPGTCAGLTSSSPADAGRSLLQTVVLKT